MDVTLVRYNCSEPRSLGDGHCLLHSVISSWLCQLPDNILITTLECIKSYIFIDLVDNVQCYLPFFQTCLHAASTFNLIQHVDVATHQCGHTLDLVITHDDDDLLSSVTVTSDSLSDHHRVEVKLNAYIPPPRTSTICRRSFKRTDVNALTDDITAACAAMCDCTAVTRHSVEQLTSRYNVRLVECLDKHAPLTYQWRLRSVDFICQHLFYTTHGLYFLVILQ